MDYNSYVWVFNVGRGLSILILTPAKYGLLVDLGSSDDFSPLEFIKENILPELNKYNGFDLAQVLITHPHADHISDIQNLEEFNFGLITGLHEKSSDEKFDFSVLGDHPNLDKYLEIIEPRNLPLQTIQYTSKNTTPIKSEYGLYYIKPPIVKDLIYKDDFKYVNGSSMVMYYRYGKNSILIPGDILPDSIEHIIEEGNGTEKRFSEFSYTPTNNTWHKETSTQPGLSQLLGVHGLSVLVAPHHGLESGFSSELYETIKDNKPSVVIISEKRHNGENDGTVDSRYQSKDGAKGVDAIIDGEVKKDNYSLTTRNGHHYLITFSPNGEMKIIGDKDLDVLLDEFER